MGLILAAGLLLAGNDRIPLLPEQWHLTTGPEFPGAQGALEVRGDTVGVESDFSGGGSYVGVWYTLPEGGDADGLEFEIRTPARVIMILAGDARGQNFFQTVHLPEAGDAFQHIWIERLTGTPEEGFGSWGGPVDGVPQGPVKQVTLFWNHAHQPELVAFPVELRRLRALYSGGDAPPPVVRPLEPAELFAPPGGGHSARLRLDYPAGTDRLDYRWRDYSGKETGGGTLVVTNGTDILLPLPETAGFHECVIPALDAVVGTAILPSFEGERDDFFAIDAVFSAFRPFDREEWVARYLDILDYCGIGGIRDRLIWTTLQEDGEGRFDWQVRRNVETIRRMAKERGIGVLDTFHQAPRWTGSAGASSDPDYYPYPRDLVKAKASWSEIGAHYQPYWSGLEVWNEPEISFGAGLPGDQVSALLRTVSYAFRERGVTTPLVSGVFTGSVTGREMMRLYLDNGLLADADAVSFHDYNMPEKLEGKIGEYREAFRDYPRSAIPLWITECGRPWPVGTARALPDDDRFSAMCIAMKSVEAKACGIARFYSFVYSYYDEVSNNFGMMDRYHTPHRAMAAYATAVRMLAGKRYAGDLDGVRGALRSRVFTDAAQERAVAVFYTGRGPGRVELPAGLTPEAVYGADGRLLAAAERWEGTDGVWYAEMPFAQAEAFLRRDTPAAALLRQAESWVPEPRLALPGVMQYDFERGTTSWTVQGYMYDDPARAVIPVIFNNLGDEALVFRPAVVLPEGAKLLQALPETVAVSGGGRAGHTMVLDLTGAFAAAELVDIVVEDGAGHADSLLIGARAWRREVVRAEPFLRLDGAGGGFGGGSWTVLEGVECWKRREGAFLPNLRAAFRWYYTPETLYCLVRVEEKTYNQPWPLAQAWRADSVQIGLQTLIPGKPPGSAFTEVTAAEAADGTGVYLNAAESPGLPSGRLEKSAMELVRPPGGYLYVIALDREELRLPEFTPGSRLGCSLIVNSSAGLERDGYLFWGDGIGDVKNPRSFHLLEFD